MIVAAYSGTTKKEYATLSKLAPVVAQPKGKPDFGTSWQEETLIAGKVVGKPEEAQRLVYETEQMIADTAAEAWPRAQARTSCANSLIRSPDSDRCTVTEDPHCGERRCTLACGAASVP